MSDGIGCKCAARCEGECCCENVSWEPKEIQTARFKIAELTLRVNALEQDLQTASDALAEVERIRLGLHNCRLFAARHRKEDWALLILGFCAEAGEVGSVAK